ncbi:putative reverse transcriptase domain-containing protein [Tanacetum coccineum]
MEPKRTTRSTPSTTTTLTTSVTDEQLKRLIDQGVADALAVCDADRSRNDEDSYDSGTGVRRQAPPAQTVFRISNCSVENQIKFATCTLLGSALTWWNSYVKTVGHDVAHAMIWTNLKKKITNKYCPRGEIKMLEAEIVMASKPKTMQDAIESATELMDNKIRTFAERQRSGEKKPYGGSKPLCSKCNYHHDGQCAPKFHKCNRVGHLAHDCRSTANANTANNQRGNGAGQKPTCYEYEAHGHFKRERPTLKNNNRDKFVIIFIDDILIHSKNKKEHEEHLKEILEFLKKEVLYAKFSNCEFCLPNVQFLGYVLLGTTEDSSKIAKSMTKLTQKGVKFDWSDKQESAFQLIKQKLCSAPILALPEGSKDFIVYYDASIKGLGTVLMQREKVIAYASRQLKIHENNYLYGTKCTVFTDHKSLQHILDQKELNMRQCRWLELLSDYDCEIRYHPVTSVNFKVSN